MNTTPPQPTAQPAAPKMKRTYVGCLLILFLGIAGVMGWKGAQSCIGANFVKEVKSYPSTTATITSVNWSYSKPGRRGPRRDTVYIKVRYEYQVDGKTYQSTFVSANQMRRDEESYVCYRCAKEKSGKLFTTFQKGYQIQVQYNPKSPDKAFALLE